MKKENTLSIIKPDAVKQNNIGEILTIIEKAQLQIVAMKLMLLTSQQAKNFYDEHKERPFYNDLVAFMISGPVVVSVLMGVSAIKKYREIMGDTNPKDAKPGTIRSLFATTIDANAVHGSDSSQSAEREISFFFTQHDTYRKE